MGERLAGLPALELFLADWFPEFVDRLERIGRDLFDRELEVLCPQAQPCLLGEVDVVADDVHLGVVEERMLVKVRRSDRQPAIVHDSDLRVDVYGAALRPRLVERAREKAARFAC